MIIPFGKYRGKSVEWLVLKRPDYVKWILDQPAPTWPLAGVKSEALRLISRFDAKPIVKPCSGSNCSKTAIRFTAYEGDWYYPNAWCETCYPYRDFPASLGPTDIETYKDVLKFVRQRYDVRDGDYRAAIDTIASAKGFPERSSPARLKEFFGEDVEPDAGEAVSQLVR